MADGKEPVKDGSSRSTESTGGRTEPIEYGVETLKQYFKVFERGFEKRLADKTFEAVQAVQVHESHKMIYIYVDVNHRKDGDALAEKYFKKIKNKEVVLVPAFEPFVDCHLCKSRECPSLNPQGNCDPDVGQTLRGVVEQEAIPKVEDVYQREAGPKRAVMCREEVTWQRSMQWVGPGSPLLVLTAADWHAAKQAGRASSLHDVTAFCCEHELKCGSWTLGYIRFMPSGIPDEIITVAHALKKFENDDDNPELMFLTEVHTTEQGMHVVEITTDGRWVNENEKGVDICLIKIRGKFDRDLLQNRFKAHCSDVFSKVTLFLDPSTFIPGTAGASSSGGDKLDHRGVSVTKYGQTSGHTHGVISSGENYVFFTKGIPHKMSGVYAVTSYDDRFCFAKHGDSGALVVKCSNDTHKRQGFGLVLGGSSINPDYDNAPNKLKPCIIVSRVWDNLKTL